MSILKIFPVILIVVFLSSCYGPHLSENKVCHMDQERGLINPDWDSFKLFCSISAVHPDQTNQDLLQCMVFVEYMKQHQCDGKSSIIPYWL